MRKQSLSLTSSRRQFLRAVGGWAALAAAVGEDGIEGKATKALAQGSDTIRIVEAYPVYINERSNGLLEPPTFSSDDDPRRWSYDGAFSQLPSAIIAVVKTDAGITGFGMGAGGSAAVEIISGHLRHLLVGTNPLNVEQLWDQMYESALFYGRRGLFAMALSAVDNALWDITGKHADRPVHQLVGGTPTDRIAVYQTAGSIAESKAMGIRNFKIPTQVGPRTSRSDLDRVVQRVLDARDILGPNARLMTDCVSRTGTVDWAVRFAERLRPAGLYFMEELLSPDDVFGYAELNRRIGTRGPSWTRVACGEHEYTQHGFDVLVRLQAADVLQPDITWCGGLTAGRRIARLVEQADLEIVPHRGGSLWGMPIALTAPSCSMAESFPSGSELLRAMTPRFENGDYLAAEDPGFGTSLTEAMVLDHRLPSR